MVHSKIVVCTLSVFCFLATVLGQNLDSVIHEVDGLSWMIIPDDRGHPHLAILNEIYSKQGRALADDIADNVKLNLYTRSNPDAIYSLHLNDVDNLQRSAFNSSHPTKFLIHGFGGSGNNGVIIDSKNAYLDMGDYNVIGVDWGALCPSPLYFEACDNAKLVGKFLGEFIEFLVQEGKATLDSMHVIGHSLGGQVAGFTGQSVSIGQVNRITGLDTAYPMFGNKNDSERLDSTDAKIVDTIHTCGGSLGFLEPYGDIDFFPNGGLSPQPGCVNDLTGGCSHGKAVTYFVDTIRNPHAYPSTQCLTLEEAEAGKCTGTHTAEMGNSETYEFFGLYYVDTTK